jgi:glycosyltransferase involved in cell wall biosynthesis
LSQPQKGRRPRLLFVVEQTLGHVAHTRNLERALAGEPRVCWELIRIPYREARGPVRLTPLGTWSWRASLVARRQLDARLRREPVDAVFLHTQATTLLCGELLARVPGVISLDATPANLDQVGRAYGHARSWERIERLKRRAVSRPLRAAAALVAWCRWAADSLVDDYGIEPERIQVIPPGVDTALFAPLAARPAGPFRVLFVGGQFERKGGPELLEAMRGLEGAELDLVTASDVHGIPPGLRCRVHRGLAPQSPELVGLYRRADVLALPTRGDCLPQAVAEALACAVPVVATPLGAIPEVVRDGITGLLVPPHDPRRLRRALEALRDSPQRRRALGERGRELAVREHDARTNNRRLIDLLCQLAWGRQPSPELEAVAMR